MVFVSPVILTECLITMTGSQNGSQSQSSNILKKTSHINKKIVIYLENNKKKTMMFSSTFILF